MTHTILSRLVDPKFLTDRNFSYQRAYLKERDSTDKYRLTKQHEQRKVYHYFQDALTKEWRFGNDNPHATKRVLGVMAIGALILYTATLVLRVIQTVIILTGVFFRSYRATFSNRKKESFSETFFRSVEVQCFQQKEGLFFIGRSLLLDTQCFLAMAVSGFAANFYNQEDQICKMEVVFSEMEQKWNKGPGFTIEPGDESTWHADNGAIANWALFLKNTDLKGRTFQEVLSQLAEIREQSNRTFYIYQYAQPLSQRFIDRLEWIEGTFPTYAALVLHYKMEAAKLEP